MEVASVARELLAVVVRLAAMGGTAATAEVAVVEAMWAPASSELASMAGPRTESAATSSPSRRISSCRASSAVSPMAGSPRTEQV